MCGAPHGTSCAQGVRPRPEKGHMHACACGRVQTRPDTCVSKECAAHVLRMWRNKVRSCLRELPGHACAHLRSLAFRRRCRHRAVECGGVLSAYGVVLAAQGPPASRSSRQQGLRRRFCNDFAVTVPARPFPPAHHQSHLDRSSRGSARPVTGIGIEKHRAALAVTERMNAPIVVHDFHFRNGVAELYDESPLHTLVPLRLIVRVPVPTRLRARLE
jgi:hypothetical protein